MDNILSKDVINDDFNYYSKLLHCFISSQSSNTDGEADDAKRQSNALANGSHKKHKVKKHNKFSENISPQKDDKQKRLSQDYSPKKERNRKDSVSAESNFSNISIEGSFSNDLLESFKKKKRKKNKISEMYDDNDLNLASKDKVTEEKPKKKRKHKKSPAVSYLEADMISYTEIKEEQCSSSSQNENEMEPLNTLLKRDNDTKSKYEETENINESRIYNEDEKHTITKSPTSPSLKKKKKRKTEKLNKISDPLNTEDESEFTGNDGNGIFNENEQHLENKAIQNTDNEMEEVKTIQNDPTVEQKNKTSNHNKNSNQSDIEIDNYSSDNESDVDLDDLVDKITEQRQIEIQSYNNILRHLFIVVDWEIPNAHMFEKSITSCPKKELQNRIKLSGVEIKKGAYSQKEDKMIKSNWERFAEIYGIPDPSVFFSFKQNGVILLPLNERIKFAQFLGRGLTNRLLFSIYQRFRVLYSVINKGRFNKYENKIILTFLRSKMANDTKKFSKLAKVLNRDRIALAKHSEVLLSEHGITETVQWNLDNMEKLLKSLLNNLGIRKVKKLRRAKISNEVWKLVSNDVHVPPKKLRYVWEYKLYPRLFIKENLDTNIVIKIILKKLQEDRVSDWKLINWEALASLFPGVTPTWVNKFVRDFMRHHVPNRKERPLKEIIEYLLSLLDNTGEFDCKFCSNMHRPLVMLKFKKGRLYEPK